MEEKIDYTDWLINNYGFQKIHVRKNVSEPIDYDGYTCIYRIHILHFLVYSPLHKSFSIRLRYEKPRGVGPWLMEHHKDIMLPRLIYTQQDAIEILTAFKID